ncbi:hypothetical protein FCV25MIE_13932 [Fagus crenata]
MEDNHVAFEDHEAATTTTINTHTTMTMDGKRSRTPSARKTAKPSASALKIAGRFLSLEQDSADRRREFSRREIRRFRRCVRSKHRINDDDDSSDGEGDRVAENGKAEESKKVKAKEAEETEEIWFDLCGFGDRLRTRGSRRVQFPWVKMFRESTVVKFADVSNAFVELLLWNCL